MEKLISFEVQALSSFVVFINVSKASCCQKIKLLNLSPQKIQILRDVINFQIFLISVSLTRSLILILNILFACFNIERLSGRSTINLGPLIIESCQNLLQKSIQPIQSPIRSRPVNGL